MNIDPNCKIELDQFVKKTDSLTKDIDNLLSNDFYSKLQEENYSYILDSKDILVHSKKKQIQNIFEQIDQFNEKPSNKISDDQVNIIKENKYNLEYISKLKLNLDKTKPQLVQYATIINDCFQNMKQEEERVKNEIQYLSSFHVRTDSNKNELKKRKQKNVNYIKDQRILKKSGQPSQISYLVHLSFYNVIRGSKQQEVIVPIEWKLSQLISLVECVVQNIKDNFIFIENCFYEHSNKFLSQNIVHNYKSGNIFKQKKQQDVQLNQLKIRLGKVYIFRHHDNCDHMFVFNKIRKFDPDTDVEDINKYPVVIYAEKTRRNKCSVCQIYYSKAISLQDQLSHKIITHYCEECYSDLQKNKKQANHQIYPYFWE